MGKIILEATIHQIREHFQELPTHSPLEHISNEPTTRTAFPATDTTDTPTNSQTQNMLQDIEKYIAEDKTTKNFF